MIGKEDIKHYEGVVDVICSCDRGKTTEKDPTDQSTEASIPYIPLSI